MNLTVLGSSSSANGYVIQNETEALVIEAGLPVSECLKALDFKVGKVAACLISHEHGDHCKYIEKYLSYMKVYCSQGTIDGIRLNVLARPTVVKSLQKFKAGNFVITPFDTMHDCNEPLGFLISHPEIGTLLFATDTFYIKYRFEGLTQIMIECNYSEEILKENVNNGIVHYNVRNRTLQSHMSINTLKKTLQANNLDKVNNIILLHLSSKNADKNAFQDEIERLTGKIVTIAEKGLTMNISK